MAADPRAHLLTTNIAATGVATDAIAVALLV